ncbi:uncharacterized protein B0J16DRAFT_326830 [Fusarium flagelliforme]|uniref:Scp-like extracellular n=1 Tax=Fusarium flagelliforme TaxID=2675880 RepID=A0A395MZK1_9HYPO|nr:uncharacterized protein B0J16DRAFT_326830 [Fusarium flagelliforme]KAH7196855.1 hypothetical protein B0J16DRAFT_326830 [Fusarium flagelliforme]RFN53140.1 scp-like extracellular [Fusarium flagelliforme]
MLRELILASLAMLSSAFPPSPPPKVSFEQDRDIALAIINEARQAGGLHDLYWDEGLAEDAQRYLDKIASGKLPWGYSKIQFPVSGEAIYKEITATDCEGQSFTATLQTAAAGWLRKENSESKKEATTNYYACMSPTARHVGCATRTLTGVNECTFYDVCIFGCRIPILPTPGKVPCPDDQDKDKKQALWMQTPFKVIPMCHLNEGFGLVDPDEDEEDS